MTDLPVVFFDISIGGAPKGRIEMELRSDVVPKTAEVRRIILYPVSDCTYVYRTKLTLFNNNNNNRTFDVFVREKKESVGRESRCITRILRFIEYVRSSLEHIIRLLILL